MALCASLGGSSRACRRRRGRRRVEAGRRCGRGRLPLTFRRIFRPDRVRLPRRLGLGGRAPRGRVRLSRRTGRSPSACAAKERRTRSRSSSSTRRGENVWWARRESCFAPPKEWQEIRVRKRQVSFAWGPRGRGKARARRGARDRAVGGDRGKGILRGGRARARRKGEARGPAGAERHARTSGGILVDFGGLRELSALVVDWPAAAVPTRFIVEISSDGRTFTAVRRVEHGGARRALLHLPETEARLVRLVLPPGDFGPPRVDVKPVDWAPTPNDFVVRLAKEAPRGLYPARLPRRADVLDGRRASTRTPRRSSSARTARSSRGRAPSRSSPSSSRTAGS